MLLLLQALKLLECKCYAQVPAQEIQQKKQSVAHDVGIAGLLGSLVTACRQDTTLLRRHIRFC